MRIRFDNCLEDEEAEESRLQRVKNHCLLGKSNKKYAKILTV